MGSDQFSSVQLTPPVRSGGRLRGSAVAVLASLLAVTAAACGPRTDTATGAAGSTSTLSPTPSASSGSASATPEGSTSPSAAAPATTAPASPGSTGGAAASPPPVSQAGRSVEVTGVIEQGVEPGCFVLTPEKGGPTYLVLGVPHPPVGVPVVVSGSVSNLISYCQQGLPLQATSIVRK